MIAELFGSASAEMVTQEVGLVRIVSAPTKQMDALKLSSVRRREEGARFHHLDLDGDVQVLFQLSLNIGGYNIWIGQITTHNVAVIQYGFKAIWVTSFGKKSLGSFSIELVPLITYAAIWNGAGGEV